MSTTRRKCCCDGGGGGGDPCLAGPGICFEADPSASSTTNAPNGNFSGGALTGLSLESSTLSYVNAGGGVEYWEGTLDESYNIAATTRGLSTFPAISRSETWLVRIGRGTSTTGYISILGLGAGNYLETINSTNDDGYIEISQTHWGQISTFRVSPGVPFDITACPTLPQSDTVNFNIYLRRVYYRNTFGSYVMDSTPFAWTWGNAITLDREVWECT